MKLTTLTASDFHAMVMAGAERLTDNVDLINALNVFPVPDGDTGTNMNMSFTSGVERMRQTSSDSVGELAGALAKGLLMGARGNSGVILSQIFRGFSQSIQGKEVLTVEEFVAAFISGVEAAYKAVMKPVEGTILTVARESAIRGEKKAKKSTDIIEVMRSIVKGADQSLERTPDLLPVLKQVGVVDSGGKGLLCIYEGFLAALTGEVIREEKSDLEPNSHNHAMFEETNDTPLSMDDITFGFCTEIMVSIGQGPTVTETFDYEEFRQLLNTKGDSLLVVADEEIIKVHIHTENPGEIMQLGQKYGELIKIKVDNMREQVRELEATDQSKHQAATRKEHKPYAIIAVAAGEGMMELFRSIGVDVVLSGGQTMNPSTEDFIKAMEQVSADKVILLPNNKNIIMAAEQVNEVSDIPTVVIPTTTIPQGIASLIAFNPEQTIEANKEAMTEMSKTVISGQVTYSIRDTEIDNVSIKKDDFMGLVNGKIVLSESTVKDALDKTLAFILKNPENDIELITLIIGEDGDRELALEISEKLEERFPDIEIEIVQGDQPVYPYIIAAE